MGSIKSPNYQLDAESEIEGEWGRLPPLKPNKKRILVDSIGFYNKLKRQDVCPNAPQVPAEGVIKRYTLINGDFSVQVMDLGATVTSIRMPDKDGKISDIALGFENIDDYTCKYGEYKIGSTNGRYAGLISDGHFKICLNEYFLNCNCGKHHKDGGIVGFSKVLWQSCVQDDCVVMSYLSPDKEECYPGYLFTQVTFHLSNDNELVIQTSAATSLPTPVSIAQNIYLNLAGQEMGPKGLDEHVLMVNADRLVEINRETNIPTGYLKPVDWSYYDLRLPRLMGKAMKKAFNGGYNETYCIIKSKRSLSFASRLLHPPSGRMVEIFTDHPGILVNTAMGFPNPDLPTYPAKKPVVERLICNMSSGSWLKEEKNKTSFQEYVFPRYSLIGVEEVPPDLDERDCETPSPKEEEMDEPSFTPKDAFLDECDPTDKDPAESEEEETEFQPPCTPKPIIGKRGIGYRIHSGIALVPIAFPDSVKHKTFPSPLLYPGEKYSRTVVYKFNLAPDRNKVVKPEEPEPEPELGGEELWESVSGSIKSKSSLSNSPTPKVKELN